MEPVTDVKKFLADLKQSFGGDNPYHLFRRFNRVEENGLNTYQEYCKGHVSMKMSDYVDYLTIRTTNAEDRTFTYENADGTIETIDDATSVVFYLLDLDLAQYFGSFDKRFKKKHKMKEILPAGSWCMLTHVSCDKGQCV